MSAEIGPGQWVEIHYTLRDGRGNLLEDTAGPDNEGPVAFVYGMGPLVSGLEAALEGARQGDVLNITVEPEDAYGTRDETDVFAVDRSEFPDPEKVDKGTEFVAEGDDGTTLTMRVVELHEDHVLVDANHPLAGLTLNYQVRVLKVRPATADEVLVARAELAETRAPEGEAS